MSGLLPVPDTVYSRRINEVVASLVGTSGTKLTARKCRRSLEAAVPKTNDPAEIARFFELAEKYDDQIRDTDTNMLPALRDVCLVLDRSTPAESVRINTAMGFIPSGGKTAARMLKLLYEANQMDDDLWDDHYQYHAHDINNLNLLHPVTQLQIQFKEPIKPTSNFNSNSSDAIEID